MITIIAIAIEDGRPFIYKQKRVGKNKKIFYIYKFRSMKTNAEAIHEEMKKQYGVEDVSFKLEEWETLDFAPGVIADLQLTLSTKDGDVYVSDIKKVAVRKKYPEDII